VPFFPNEFLVDNIFHFLPNNASREIPLNFCRQQERIFNVVFGMAGMSGMEAEEGGDDNLMEEEVDKSLHLKVVRSNHFLTTGANQLHSRSTYLKIMTTVLTGKFHLT
jgi:hypothetical protein